MNAMEQTAAAVEITDLEAFDRAYPAWLEKRRADLEASDWKTAFTDYPFSVNDSAPWTPVTKPLAESTVMVLSTAGLFIAGEQPRFNAEDIEGDWTFRELAADLPYASLDIAHTHYPHDSARQDLNAVYPLERLRELAGAGVIGGLRERHIAISGYCTRIDKLMRDTIPQILQGLREDPPDVVLHIPV